MGAKHSRYEHDHGDEHDHAHHHDHDHDHDHDIDRVQDRSALRTGLTLILAFMALEVTVAIFAHSLALLSDAAHMLTDAAALAMSLLASNLALRPAKGSLTYGLGRAEILSAAANGVTLWVLGIVIAYGAIAHLVTPRHVDAGPVLGVALIGILVNLTVERVLHNGSGHNHSLNVEGSYRHIVTDLVGFIATAVAAVVILTTGFDRADAIASLVIAAVMFYSGYGLGQQALRVVMEAAPPELDPAVIGPRLAAWPGVVEIHDLHVWEVTSGFSALSAHVLVGPDSDCHDIRRELATLLTIEFELAHSTLQVEHAALTQGPIQIELGITRKDV